MPNGSAAADYLGPKLHKYSRKPPNTKGLMYFSGFPFRHEYIDQILRPRVLAVVAPDSPVNLDGNPPTTMKEFRKKFNDTYNVHINERKCQQLLSECGLQFARRQVLIDTALLRKGKVGVASPPTTVRMPVPAPAQLGDPFVSPGGPTCPTPSFDDELAGPTFQAPLPTEGPGKPKFGGPAAPGFDLPPDVR